MKTFKVAAAGTVAALCTTAIVLWATRDDIASQATPTTESAAAPEVMRRPVPEMDAVQLVEPSTSPLPANACAFELGQRFSFAASTVTTWVLPERMKAMLGAASEGNTRWSRELHFEVMSVAPDGAVLLGRMQDPSNAAAQGSNPELDAAFLARVNPRCAVAGFARLKSTPREAARAQQSALHELWFTLPDVGSVAFDYQNATGQARGAMTVEGGTLVRRISSYPTTWSRDMTGLMVTESSLLIRRGDAPWFESMTGRESVSASSIDSGRVELSVIKTGPKPSLLSSASRREADYIWENQLGPIIARLTSAPPPDHEQRVAAMRTVKYDTAVSHFTNAVDTGQNIAAQWPDMAAFLDAHPDRIEEFSVSLVTELAPQYRMGGFLALSKTQHAAARDALLDVWHERGLSMMDRTRASLALSTRADVGVGLARELRAEAARRPNNQSELDVSRQALLHLGILAGTHPDNADVAREARQAVLSAAGSAKTAEEAGLAFAAIGNTGDVSLLPAVERASRHEDGAMRAAVAIGMRRMPVEAVRDFTVEWLRRETDPDVKREIFEVVHHQYQDAGRPVGDELQDEALKHLRQQPRLLTRQSLFRILQPHQDREAVRAALRDQLRVEYEQKSGLFAFVAGLLPERDVQSVLTGIPSLNDQLGNVSAQPPSSRAVADAVPDTVPEALLPAAPTAAELEVVNP